MDNILKRFCIFFFIINFFMNERFVLFVFGVWIVVYFMDFNFFISFVLCKIIFMLLFCCKRIFENLYSLRYCSFIFLYFLIMLLLGVYFKIWLEYLFWILLINLWKSWVCFLMIFSSFFFLFNILFLFFWVCDFLLVIFVMNFLCLVFLIVFFRVCLYFIIVLDMFLYLWFLWKVIL